MKFTIISWKTFFVHSSDEEVKEEGEEEERKRWNSAIGGDESDDIVECVSVCG